MRHVDRTTFKKLAWAKLRHCSLVFITSSGHVSTAAVQPAAPPATKVGKDLRSDSAAITITTDNDYNCAGMRMWAVGIIVVVLEHPI